MPIAPVNAATITVGGGCTLAEAIANANNDNNGNNNGCAAGSGADTITLTANITLSAALPNIASNITIEGAGKSISGDNTYHIFHITSGPVTINNLTMQNGVGIIRRFNEISGGAIFVAENGGALTVSKSRFLNNTATPNSNCDAHGGAIFSLGSSITVDNSVFRGNASPVGVAISASSFTTLTVRRSSFTGHKHPAGMPESCKTSSHVVRLLKGGTISNVTISGNAASGISLEDKTTTISHSTIVNNKDYTADNTDPATREGGGITQGTITTFAGRANLYNNIIANNSPYDCSGDQAASTWVLARANNLIEDNTCSPAYSGDPKLASFRGAPGYHPPWQGSPVIDAGASAHCTAALNTDKDIRGVARPIGSACDLGSYEGFLVPDSGGGGGGNDGDDAEPTSTPVPGPRCAFCPDLLARGFVLKATYGLDSGVQFRQVDRGGIGDQSVLDDGFMDAVDVYGYAEQGVEVCFPGSGKLLLLDAAFSPRMKVPLAATSQHGMTCGQTNRAGTIVLLNGPPAPAAPATAVAPPNHSLFNCMVTTNYVLNFRSSPGGPLIHFTDPWGAEIAGWLPYNVMLTALARTADWFKVDYHGTQGWIFADYVSPQGDCG